MSVWAAILAVLKSLPEIVAGIKRLDVAIQDGRLQAWLGDLHGTLDKLEKAETSEDRTRAAKSLVDLVRRLG